MPVVGQSLAAAKTRPRPSRYLYGRGQRTTLPGRTCHGRQQRDGAVSERKDVSSMEDGEQLWERGREERRRGASWPGRQRQPSATNCSAARVGSARCQKMNRGEARAAASGGHACWCDATAAPGTECFVRSAPYGVSISKSRAAHPSTEACRRRTATSRLAGLSASPSPRLASLSRATPLAFSIFLSAIGRQHPRAAAMLVCCAAGTLIDAGWVVPG